ncbi:MULTISPECIES: alpha-L-rhamnosidase C-terminal domain-containing protein [unclassified Streptomyces]|uniref:alpha-L-rhamnosidase-related protein n=1 Tax=unclassified Streptomyces TaxID=2593676 RepID=UPI00093D21DC|nr:family 78 glycoside hydrolase catalytic domain [Streptomyces sp. TSRI0281]OKI34285.1 hypothetical protein A6A29_18590 [Streptomyces sp. TSRI0281]
MSDPTWGDWHGQWIWGEERGITPPGPGSMLGAPDPEVYDRRMMFRRDFELSRVPASAPYRITSDSRHVLYINGVEAARGPVRHGPRMLHYDTGDAAPLLLPGRNSIAVLVRHYGHAVPWWEPSPWTFELGGGALVAELRLTEDRWIATDSSWSCRPAGAWTPQRPHSQLVTQTPESLDARLLDPAWTRAVPGGPTPDRPARVLSTRAVVGPKGGTRPDSEPYGALLPRPLPPLTDTVRGAESLRTAPLPGPLPPDPRQALAEALRATGDAAPATADATHPLGAAPVLLLVDFGRVVAGHLRFSCTAESGTEISGALVELPTAAALDAANTFHYIARGHEDTFETSDPVGGRYALLVATGTGSLRLGPVQVRERLRPRPAGPYFSCDDAELNEIHRVGLRTVDLTAQDAYLDCPTREQRAWTGDSVVHQAVDLVTNPDWSLARWSPQLAAQPRSDGMLRMVAAGDFARDPIPTIPDWSLHWVRSVHQLYRCTGDRELVARLLATAEGVLRWFLPFRRPDGLLHRVSGWVLIDWSPVQVTGASAALNALWARGLADFAEMADWLGDAGRARWAREAHQGVVTGFEAFWDADRGAYRDNLDGGRLGTSVSEHTHAAAVCGHLVPDQRLGAVRELLLDRAAMFTRSPMRHRGSDAGGPLTSDPVSDREGPDWDTESLVVGAQPFFRYVVHDALALLGAADRIEGLCHDWTALLESGGSAFRECWEGGSYCHGWSATPSRDLLVHTLGVTPAEPGYLRVRVAPRLGGLSWARGAVPTPGGLVQVDATPERVRIESPVPVEVLHPDGSLTHHPYGTSSIDLRKG